MFQEKKTKKVKNFKRNKEDPIEHFEEVDLGKKSKKVKNIKKNKKVAK